MQQIIKIVFALGLLIASVDGADIVGVGYAKTHSESSKEALADLSGNIKSEGRSSFESIEDDTSSVNKSNLKVSSNLPLMGFDVEAVDRGRDIETTVTMHSAKVKKLYTDKLKSLHDEINTLVASLKTSSDSLAKLKIFETIYSLLNEYDRYETVANILGAKRQDRPLMSKSEVNLNIEKMQSNIDTIKMACQILGDEFPQENIFVYAPTLEHSSTISSFGAVFQKTLQGSVKSAHTLSNAKFTLVGEYVLGKKALILNYTLLDTLSNKVIKSKTPSISHKAYANLEVKPKNQSFDALISNGIITSSDLRVSLKSNKGSESLLFRDGEEVELFIKLNKKGYVHIVGFTQTKEGEFSYLLELSEGHGESKFRKFINEDDANHWLSLGKFDVAPPFGVERLQILASTQKEQLPSTKYDDESEYYIVSRDVKKALVKTRGLHMSKKHKNRVEKSEDVLSFTTVK